jgi:hypothetical protein
MCPSTQLGHLSVRVAAAFSIPAASTNLLFVFRQRDWDNS